MKWRVFGLLPIIFIFAQLVNCGKIEKLVGLDDEDKRFESPLVSSFMSAGSHLVCWDGKDSQGNFVSAGQYFFKMKANSFSKDVLVKALEGSSGSLNEPPQVDTKVPSDFNLQVQPNPFYIQDGTYAVLSLPEVAQVVLTVINR